MDQARSESSGDFAAEKPDYIPRKRMFTGLPKERGAGAQFDYEGLASKVVSYGMDALKSELGAAAYDMER
eukprot:SAG31_NODE_3062_length_4731_cov_8.218480_3_plen_70_part_00